jgi:anti-sigma B factor antagonist
VHQLRLSTRAVDGHAVVTLGGELDIASADELRSHLRSARRAHGDHVVLDLADLEFMDSRGLSVIIGCHKSVGGADGSLGLVAPPPIVRRTLEITGLDRRFRIFRTIAEAVSR